MPGLAHVKPNLLPALYGSLAGGVLFGVMMQMMDMLPMVAALVGADSVAIGWIVHLTISALFAVPLALLLSTVRWNPVATGVVWGVLAWVLGALLIMPLWLGMPGMVFNLSGSTPWMSLLGHVLYGAVAGGVVFTIQRRPSGDHVATAA